MQALSLTGNSARSASVLLGLGNSVSIGIDVSNKIVAPGAGNLRYEVSSEYRSKLKVTAMLRKYKVI